MSTDEAKKVLGRIAYKRVNDEEITAGDLIEEVQARNTLLFLKRKPDPLDKEYMRRLTLRLENKQKRSWRYN